MKRRSLLKHLATAGSGLPLLSCAGLQPAEEAAREFRHGVASGDPQADRIIIWSRVSGYSDAVEVSWELSAEAGFQNIARSGTLRTSAAKDFSCKVDVDGLQAGRHYYYRFRTASETSVTGRCKTLADESAASIRLGLASCANYSFGYFNAYRMLAQHDDLDAIYHAGDYLYEYQKGGYDSPQAEAMGRVTVPQHELLSLQDYRMRHAQYKSDPDLQAAHARHAFICAWDDHEVANDSYTQGAENHNAGEGDWEARKAAALQAYFEWMPVREPEQRLENSYRSFQFGRLASLIVLETRLSGRDKALDLNTDLPYLQSGPNEQARPDVETFQRDILHNPDRRMIGPQQENWFTGELKKSAEAGTPWQIIGNQTLMARILAPDFKNHMSEAEVAGLIPYAQRFVEFSELGLPYNLDAWDGYPVARQRLFDAIEQHANNTIVLTGDSHNAWAIDIENPASGTNIAAEFAVNSITSPGASDILKLDNSRMPRMVQGSNPHVRYTDTEHRGYAVVNIDQQAVTTEFYNIDSIETTRAQQSLGQAVKVSVQSRPGTQPIELV